METALDPGQVVLDEIAALEVERARIEARIASAMLDFQDLRRRAAESRTDAIARRLEASFAADELGVVLHQPIRTVQCRLAEARKVRGRLPLTWLAFLGGRIDAYRISIVAAAAEKMTDNHNLMHLDYTVVHDAPSRTAAQLKGCLNRFVARWEPDQGAVRAKTEQAKRSVWVDHQADGMSYLHAYLPTPDAVRIDHQLTAEARKHAADERTFDQRRADLFIQQMLSTDDLSTSSRAVIGITVPITSLAGLTDQPGESFDGSFALPAGMVRDLAAQPGTLFFRIIKDPLGHLLDVTELGRFPSGKLRIGVQARDGTCRFTTCTRPAMECDLDHEIPTPAGPTSGTNLRSLGRRHHNMKTHDIAEPTTFSMRAPAASPAEHDLATYTVRMSYAA